MAVLKRDLTRTQSILRERPHLIEKERNIFGQTPVFLAVGWPKGLELLLQAANDSILLNSYARPQITSPLDYAIALGCDKSIQLLETTHLALNFGWSRFVSTSILKPAASDCLPRLILEQCRQLQDFAITTLPEGIINLYS